MPSYSRGGSAVVALWSLAALVAPSFSQQPPKSGEPPTTNNKKADPDPKTTLSKQLRTGLKDRHDKAAESVFAESVQQGTLTKEQYTIFLEQRLALFDAFGAKLAKGEKLPKGVVGIFGEAEAEVASALRKDLGLKDGNSVDRKRLLKGTVAILDLIDGMDEFEVATAAYISLGETAFGATTLAKSLEEAGMKNTAGLRAYSVAKFFGLVERINKIDDAATHAKMLKAGEKFYDAVIIANASTEYAPKK